MNQWIKIVRKCRDSGQTVISWCAEHEINSRKYYYWLKKSTCVTGVNENGFVLKSGDKVEVIKAI